METCYRCGAHAGHRGPNETECYRCGAHVGYASPHVTIHIERCDCPESHRAVEVTMTRPEAHAHLAGKLRAIVAQLEALNPAAAAMLLETEETRIHVQADAALKEVEP